MLYHFIYNFYYYLWKNNYKFDKKINVENFNYLGLYLLTTIISMVTLAIIIDKIGVVNANEARELGNVKLLNFITAVFFAPFIEELIFRYFVFREALKINKVFAHIFSALLFGFSHVWDYVLIQGNYAQLISCLIYVALGLNVSLLYSKTKNICFPILLHMIINYIAVMN